MPSAYATKREVAERLGVSVDEFRRRRPTLVRAGFPEPDPLFDRYLVDDVEAWLKRRRRIEPDDGTVSGEVRLDAL